MTAMETAGTDTLRLAALLAGLGERATEAADRAAAGLAATAPDRSCIDGGNRLILSLLAPGRRGLRVQARQPDRPGEPGVLRWSAIHQHPGAAAERWSTSVYLGEPAGAWRDARDAARRAGGEDRLGRFHATLGPNGRICTVTRSTDQGPGRAWVAWQLDRGVPPAVALAACGLQAAWQAVAEPLGWLLGLPAARSLGPWSLGVALHGDPGQVRVGTTAWARTPEDAAKRRRMVELVDRLGGDRRHAEALYKLLGLTGRGGARIGRAVEAEVAGGRLASVQLHLGVPGSATGVRPTNHHPERSP
jgi:hypothetical protein